MHNYFTFGLKLKSALPLPELGPFSFSGKPDVIIEYDVATHALDCYLHKTFTQSTILQIKDVAWYRISNGNHIHILKDPNASYHDVMLFLLGSVMTLLLQQRGCLVLHACAVEYNHQAYLFAAHSGIGKSTLAYALYQRGFRVLTDDVACLVEDNQRFIIQPGYPRVRLTQASADRLNADTNNVPEVVTCDKKYVMNCSARWQTTPLPVASLCVMEAYRGASIEHSIPQGLDKFICLKEQSARYAFLLKQRLVKQHFEQISRLAQQINLHRIQRPSDQFNISSLIDVISDLFFSSAAVSSNSKVR